MSFPPSLPWVPGEMCTLDGGSTGPEKNIAFFYVIKKGTRGWGAQGEHRECTAEGACVSVSCYFAWF